MYNTELLKFSDLSLKKACNFLDRGEIIGIPTETVYGLAAKFNNIEAISKIFKAKGRPSDNPLIIHISEKNMIFNLIDEKISLTIDKIINKFWPGPLTIIFKKSKLVNDTVTAGLDTVAIRLPESKVFRKIISELKTPIAAPSANISGKPSPTKAEHVYNDLKGKIPLIIDGGDCNIGIESTVIKVKNNGEITLLRPGGVTIEDLKTISSNIEIKDGVEKGTKNNICLSPGLMYKHYSPDGEVFLINGTIEKFGLYLKQKCKNFEESCAIIFNNDILNIDIKKFYYGNSNDFIYQSKNIFEILRQVDKYKYKNIYIHAPEKISLGYSIYNRLIRASQFKVVYLD